MRPVRGDRGSRWHWGPGIGAGGVENTGCRGGEEGKNEGKGRLRRRHGGLGGLVVALHGAAVCRVGVVVIVIVSVKENLETPECHENRTEQKERARSAQE